MAEKSAFARMRESRAELDEKLAKEAEKANGKVTDPTYWRPSTDKDGNGFAIIRFMPAPDGEDVPFVRIWDHAFKGPGGSWYIENSLTTINLPDPVAEYNSTLWNSGSEAKKEIARKQKRRLRFVSNVYVVKDADAPENEGKVFRYKFGKKIFDKINDAMNGDKKEGIAGFNPFDLWTGANFNLRIRRVDDFPNYDKSSFDQCGALSADDSFLERIYSQTHSLQEVIAPKQFKPYEELKAKLNRVLDLANGPVQSGHPRPEPDPRVSGPAPQPSSHGAAIEHDDEDSGIGGTDEALDYFKSLAS